MTAIPPIGASMPPVVSEAAAAGAPAAGDQLQALLEGLDFTGLQSQFFSSPELLGALGAQGNATLREFLGRLKKADANFKAFKSKMHNPDANNAEGADTKAADTAADTVALLHGGPAREPFERGDSPHMLLSEIKKKMIQRIAEDVENTEAASDAQYIGTVAVRMAKAFGELIKGQ
jgi:hypothetical protein